MPASASFSLLDASIIAAFIGLIAAVSVAFITRQIKISEFRQAWINNLRSDIALYISKADEWVTLYYMSNGNQKSDADKETIPEIYKVKFEAFTIRRRIEMMFKPGDNEDFLKDLQNLCDPRLIDEYGSHEEWNNVAKRSVADARRLLKREWEVTKKPWLNLIHLDNKFTLFH